MHVSKLLGTNITTFVLTLPVGLITSEVELNDIWTLQYTRDFHNRPDVIRNTRARSRVRSREDGL